MGKKRKNGEGTYGEKTINGYKYKYYKDSNGKYFYGKTYKECDQKCKNYHDSTNKKKPNDVQSLTVPEYLDSWLKVKSIEIKENTASGYQSCINGQFKNFKKCNLKNIQVGNLTQEDIQNYYIELSKNYSRATIKKNFAIFSQAIKDARTNKNTNPFSSEINMNNIKLPNEDNVKVKKKEIHFLSEKDIILFCKEARRINTKGYNWGGKIGRPTYGNNANLLIFILYTGIRISEGIELKWKHIDLTKGKEKVTIIENTARVKRDEGYVDKTSSTKTKAGTRIIPLSSQALKVLETEIELNPKHKENDYVFITENGGKIKSRQNVNRTLEHIMSRAGCSLDKLTPHELRHTFGSLLIKKGVDIKVVSKLLGHKDISVTYNIYIHVLQEQEIEAIGKLDALEF